VDGVTEEYSVSLTVEANPDRADELVEFDLNEDGGDGTLQGTAKVDMEQVLVEAIERAEVTNSNAPSHIARALEHAINDT